MYLGFNCDRCLAIEGHAYRERDVVDAGVGGVGHHDLDEVRDAGLLGHPVQVG